MSKQQKMDFRQQMLEGFQCQRFIIANSGMIEISDALPIDKEIDAMFAGGYKAFLKTGLDSYTEYNVQKNSLPQEFITHEGIGGILQSNPGSNGATIYQSGIVLHKGRKEILPKIEALAASLRNKRPQNAGYETPEEANDEYNEGIGFGNFVKSPSAAAASSSVEVMAATTLLNKQKDHSLN